MPSGWPTCAPMPERARPDSVFLSEHVQNKLATPIDLSDTGRRPPLPRAKVKEEETLLAERPGAPRNTPVPVLDAGIARLISEMRAMPGALLPLLHAIQDLKGFIPPDSVGFIAEALSLSRAEVHGVITFYHHFKTKPDARHVIQVCKAEACQSMGSDALWEHACSHLQVDPHAALHGAHTADGSVTLRPVYCLGLCSSSPAMVVDDQVHARVKTSDFDRLVALVRSEA